MKKCRIEILIKKLSKIFNFEKCRKKKSTTDVIWTHKFNMATTCKTKDEIFVTSIDMSSAFDIICRTKLMQVCENVLPKQDEVTFVKYLLSSTKMCIKLENRMIDCFNTAIGSPQGDSSSPILFAICLKEPLKALPIELMRRVNLR